MSTALELPTNVAGFVASMFVLQVAFIKQKQNYSRGGDKVGDLLLLLEGAIILEYPAILYQIVVNKGLVSDVL